ncbi:MAG: hypothetical protein RI885_2563, partial [Actinomycetota bacterium]
TGAPVVCLICGNYIADFMGADTTTVLIAATFLLILVLTVTILTHPETEPS